MTYQKPELFVLTLAAPSVRSGDVSDTTPKTSSVKEAGIRTDDSTGGDHEMTSSSSGAYEADE